MQVRGDIMEGTVGFSVSIKPSEINTVPDIETSISCTTGKIKDKIKIDPQGKMFI